MFFTRFFDSGAAEVTVGGAVDLSTLGTLSNHTAAASEDTGAAPAANDGGNAPESGSGAPDAAATSAAPEANASHEAAASEASSAQPAAAAPAAEELTVDSVLSKFDRTTLLKAMGYDEFDLGFLEYRRANGGDATPYLEAKTKDWTAATAEELMRDELRRGNPGLSDDELDILYRSDVVKKYHLGEFDDEDDKAAGQIKLRREVERLRQERIAEQAAFKAPALDPTADAQRQQEAQARAERERYDAFVQSVDQSAELQKLMESKSLAIGPGQNSYNFSVDPAQIRELTVDTNKFFALLANPDGSLNMQKWMKVAAFALNQEAYEKSIFDHGRETELASVIDENQNAGGKGAHVRAGNQAETLGQAFATRAVPIRLG